MTGPMIAAQRNSTLARPHSEGNKQPNQGSRFLLDNPLSSSPFSTNSTRHSVTSRIETNSRLLSHLIFSTRHLNATLGNRDFVEKFNTCLRFFAASLSLARPQSLAALKIAPRNERSHHPSSNKFSRASSHTFPHGGLAERAMWLRQRARANADWVLPDVAPLPDAAALLAGPHHFRIGAAAESFGERGRIREHAVGAKLVERMGIGLGQHLRELRSHVFRPDLTPAEKGKLIGGKAVDGRRRGLPLERLLERGVGDRHAAEIGDAFALYELAIFVEARLDLIGAAVASWLVPAT
jgi:hypothetical protein